MKARYLAPGLARAVGEDRQRESAGYVRGNHGIADRDLKVLLPSLVAQHQVLQGGPLRPRLELVAFRPGRCGANVRAQPGTRHHQQDNGPPTS
jgi:hypothetical protein